MPKVFSAATAGFFAVLALAAVLSSCGRPSDPWGGTTKPRVLTAFTPLHCFAASIAEPDAEVRCLLTATGPHDFHPGPQDARMVSTADLFIANGLGLDEFIDQLVRNAGSRRLKVFRAGDAIPKDQIIASKGHYHGDVFHAGSHDPHIWLGIEEAKIIVQAIRDELIALDKAHERGYRERTDKYLAELDTLKARGNKLKDLPGGLVTFHDSFAYFGRSFGIPIAGSIRGLHGEDISPAALREQTEEFRKKGVRLIGIEPQYPNIVAKKLADAIGKDQVKTVHLDPIETGPLTQPYYVDKGFYVQKMAENIDNLLKALP